MYVMNIDLILRSVIYDKKCYSFDFGSTQFIKRALDH